MAAQAGRPETTLLDNLVAAALAGDRQTVRQMLLMLDAAERAVIAEAIDLIRQQLDLLPTAVQAGAQALHAAFPTLHKDFTYSFFEKAAAIVLDAAQSVTQP